MSNSDTERGRNMNKKQKREQTTLRLPAELKRQLQQEAASMDLSLNAYILLTIDRGRQSLHQ